MSGNKKRNGGLRIFRAAMLSALVGGAAMHSFANHEPAERWYSSEQAAAGEKLYAKHCFVCHGANGAGSANWRQRGADGHFPPPPLNGTAHTWHHTLAQLRRTIIKGNAQLGGAMPGFGDKLTPEERDQIIAHFQSQWPDNIYRTWAEKVEKLR